MIRVKVKPNSKKEEIKKVEDHYVICVKEPADKDKANKAVLKIISKHFKKKALIKSGRTSKEKLIQLEE